MNKNLNQEWCKKFDESLEKHIKYFREAAKLIGGIPKRIWLAHDESKYSKHEYPAYVRRFGGGIKNEHEFGLAWLHHIHNNPHHPEHWVIPAGCGEIQVVLPMHEIYAREMVADWMGSSMAYTGTFNMKEWLTINFDSIVLHKDTRILVINILKDIGQEVEQ